MMAGSDGPAVGTEFRNEASLARPVLSALLHAGVRYCLLHGAAQIDMQRTSDLDLMVLPAHLPLALRVLSSLPGFVPVQLMRHEHTAFYVVLWRRAPGAPQFIAIDLATDFRRDGCIYFSADRLLADARTESGIPCTSPALEFAYLLVKKLSKGTIPGSQKLRLAELVQSLAPTATQTAVSLLGPVSGPWLVRAISHGQWNDVDEALPALRRALFRHAAQDGRLTEIYWVADILRRIGRWRQPTGVMVAVMGPDGAGKSTLIARLQTDLARAFRRTARYHFRPALGQRHNGTPLPAPHAEIPRGKIGSIFKLAYYVLDFLVGFWLRVRPQLVASTLVLFDRYYDDLLVDPCRYRLDGPAWAVSMLRAAIPGPELLLLLDAPPTILRTRKRELALDEASRQREAYRRLAWSHRNAIVIDAAQPPDAVVESAELAILSWMQRRFLRRLSWMIQA